MTNKTLKAIRERHGSSANRGKEAKSMVKRGDIDYLFTLLANGQEIVEKLKDFGWIPGGEFEEDRLLIERINAWLEDMKQ